MSLVYYFQVTITLAVFAGMLTGILYLTKRIQKSKYNGDIQILDRRSVHNNVALLLVNVRGKLMLIGVGNREIRVIHKFI
ncbi:flagellar biosynthetic protein FliO [Thermoproteota archaeon]